MKRFYKEPSFPLESSRYVPVLFDPRRWSIARTLPWLAALQIQMRLDIHTTGLQLPLRQANMVIAGPVHVSGAAACQCQIAWDVQ